VLDKLPQPYACTDAGKFSGADVITMQSLCHSHGSCSFMHGTCVQQAVIIRQENLSVWQRSLMALPKLSATRTGKSTLSAPLNGEVRHLAIVYG
jgi:hypothetical protein